MATGDGASPQCPAGATVGQALLWGTRALAAAESVPGVTPRLDAELLLSAALGLERAALHLRWHEPLGDAPSRRYGELIRRRTAHEPVAYLLGRRHFYDVELRVDRRALIPRPESEHLVELALAWARRRAPLRVADVGTGSGALALVLARHLPGAEVWAVDLSLEALVLADENLARYGLSARVRLACGDLLAPLGGPFDLIVANLPYIPADELASLSADIRDYEPALALDGGAEGLALIRRLLAQSLMPGPAGKRRLRSPGLLLLEVDPRQAATVVKEAAFLAPGAACSVQRDYAGLERVVRIELV